MKEERDWKQLREGAHTCLRLVTCCRRVSSFPT